MEKTRILLAEDDENLAMILKEYLELKGFYVDHAVDGNDAIEKFKKEQFNICLFDVMMPNKDGFTLGREVRELDEAIPIIFLTAKSMLQDKSEGFNLGADDYITKPFSSEELYLRINSLLRRASITGVNLNAVEQSTFKIGKYELDYRNRTLKFENEEELIKLTAKEADLLKLLYINRHDVVERSKALKQIWKNDSYFSGRSMDVYIAKIRKYLVKDPNIQIVNFHGTGFKLLEN